MTRETNSSPRRSPRRQVTLAALVVALAITLPTAAAQLYSTADEVTDAMSAQPSPSTTISTMTMTITAGSGHSLTRQMQVWSGRDGDAQVIKFLEPADVRGSGFLSVTDADGSSETLIYLPSLGRVRRVAAGQEGDAFFGSDFSYEEITSLGGDLTGDDYDATLLGVEDGPVYRLEATAVEGSGATYDRIVFEVPEETLLPSLVEFYRGGELVKVLEIGGTTEVGGYVLPTELSMQTVAAGSRTDIVIGEYSVDVEIPDDVFSERFLQR